MKLSEKLWCDLKTDSEKQNWLLMGRGYETGVVAHVIQTDLANTYIKIIHLTQERDTYRELCVELLQTLRHIEGAVNDIQCSRAAMAIGARAAITKAEKLLGENNAT